MNIFVFEYASAGGEGAEPFMEEGTLMLSSLLGDLSRLDGMSVVAILSPALDSKSFNADKVIRCSADVLLKTFERELQKADAVWIIAPECDGLLHRLTVMAEGIGVMVIGASSGAVKVCGSKLKTYSALKGVVRMPDTKPFDGTVSAFPTVIKPVDGAGSENLLLVRDESEVPSLLKGCLLQDYAEGEHLSAGIIGSAGDTKLLGVCRQLNVFGQGAVKPELITDYQNWDMLEFIVKLISKKVSGLNGYWGIDFVDSDGDIILIEINPRLTTSYRLYAGAAGFNIAELVLNQFASALVKE